MINFKLNIHAMYRVKYNEKPKNINKISQSRTNKPIFVLLVSCLSKLKVKPSIRLGFERL